MDQSTNGGCIGSRFDHGLQIKLEVADVPVAKLVALLAEHDLVNEPTGLRIRAWQPWGHDTRKTSLKRFQEGHEIPHSEYVRLEKNPQVLDVSDLTIKWMVHKALARRGNNLEKARNRFSLSWHMLSMQQTGPGDARIFGHADSQADHLPLGSTPEAFRRNKTGFVAQYLRMECSFSPSAPGS